MAASKIKKKSPGGKDMQARRQGAIPCMIIIAIGLAIILFLFFASLAHASMVLT